jgi:hypothetical protein
MLVFAIIHPDLNVSLITTNRSGQSFTGFTSKTSPMSGKLNDGTTTSTFIIYKCFRTLFQYARVSDLLYPFGPPLCMRANFSQFLLATASRA